MYKYITKSIAGARRKTSISHITEPHINFQKDNCSSLRLVKCPLRQELNFFKAVWL